MNRLLRLLVASSLVAGAGVALPALTGYAVAQAADGAATKVVRAANDTIGGLLRKQVAAGSDAEKKAAAAVTASVRDFLDIEELGQRAMVDSWGTMTAAQRTEFLGLLRSLIEANYVKGLRSNLDYTVAYVGEAAGPDGARVVKTTITSTRKGRPVTIKVDYVVRSSGPKQALRCYDVSTDGVSLVDNYRAQFRKIVAKDGVDGLIRRMKAKQAKAGL
ncbi:MAG: ABC transporter substrate-binding protein [Kofleriaceae bacterium]